MASESSVDSMAYIVGAYRVPAKVGGRVTYTGADIPRDGTIVGVEDSYLLIQLDGDSRAARFHPTWELTYMEASAP